MKTILVATDFSASALNAATYAADMAKAMDANLVLFHTYQVPVTYAEVPIAADMAGLVKAAKSRLAAIKNDLQAGAGVQLQIAIELREGEFFNALKAVCEQIQPYAVVMGSQGTTFAERLLFGGHTVYAMQNLQWPLITVPPGAYFSAVKKIALACDFEKVLETVPVDEIKKVVYDFNAKLFVLNTGQATEYNSDLVFGSGMLQELIGALHPRYHFITAENTEQGILDFVQANDIDLLVVLPKRHGVLHKLLHKSITKHFVLHSHVPVMAIHAEHSTL